VIVGGIAVWRLTSTTQPAQQSAVPAGIRTVAATTGTFTRTIRVAGQTSAIHLTNITAPLMRGREAGSEMILLYLAPPGSWVKKGALIAQIDAQAMQDHVDDLADTIEEARTDIEKRRAEQAIEWENLQQNLRVAKSNVDKLELDYKASETLTDIQRQLARLSLEEAQATYKQQSADLAAKRKGHAADIRILELTMARHQRHRDRHARDIKNFSIYAPMDGLIVMEQTFRGSEFGQIQQGDQLRSGQRFMKVVNTKEMQVEGVVNQAESGQFRVGQRARVKLDAFPGIEFDGEVHSIGALATSGSRSGSQYVRTVPVRVSIEGSHEKLIPDLSASADVVVETASNQVTVPSSAVRTENGKSVVYVRTATGFETRPVDIGMSNGTHVAIASGLNAGEQVRVN
jgi:multidrug resistance efflux pump